MSLKIYTELVKIENTSQAAVTVQNFSAQNNQPENTKPVYRLKFFNHCRGLISLTNK